MKTKLRRKHKHFINKFGEQKIWSYIKCRKKYNVIPDLMDFNYITGQTWQDIC